MPVTSPHVLTVGTVSYDLRKVASWWDSSPQTVPTSVTVRFIDSSLASVLMTKTAFEAQLQLSLNAS